MYNNCLNAASFKFHHDESWEVLLNARLKLCISLSNQMPQKVCFKLQYTLLGQQWWPVGHLGSRLGNSQGQ